MENFFQSIINAAVKGKPDVEPQRVWTADFAEISPQAALFTDIERKPDLLAIPLGQITPGMKSKDLRLKWRFISLTGEIRMGTTSKVADLYIEVAQKALCAFEAQWNRGTLYTFGIVRERIFLSQFSRAGVIHSEPFDIHLNPEILIHLVLGLTFGSDEQIGFDPTFSVGDYKRSTIKLGRLSFNIIQSVWKSYVIAGRATQCFIVEKDGQHRVAKDVWVARYRKPTEWYFFAKAAAAGVKNIPTLLGCVNVHLQGVLDVTETGTNGVPLEERLHRRFLYKECGYPIWVFQSIKELLFAFIDVIIAHKELYFNAGILHRDISIWNIMLLVDPLMDLDNVTTLRKGLLIDLDYARDKFVASLAHIKDYDETNDLNDGEFHPLEPQSAIDPGSRSNSSVQEHPENNTGDSDMDIESEDEKPNVSADDVKKSNNRGHRTGTCPFIAYRILTNPKTVHRYYHDLESFVYVITYICCKYYGPYGLTKKLPIDELPPFIQHWFYSPTTSVIGHSKFAFLYMSDTEFDEQFGDFFTPYFQGLKPLVRQLRSIVAGAKEDSPETEEMHDKMIKIIREVAEKLPMTDDMSSINISGTDPETQFPRRGPAFKRQRDIDEPSDFVATELHPKFNHFLTSVGDGHKRKRAKVKVPSSEEPIRENDVFDV